MNAMSIKIIPRALSETTGELSKKKHEALF